MQTNILILPFFPLLSIGVLCGNEVFVTRGRQEDKLIPKNCSMNPRYLTSNCHGKEKGCPGSCSCKNKTTLFVDENTNLKCEENAGKNYGCQYAFENEYRFEKLNVLDVIDDIDNWVGKVLLRNGLNLKSCTLIGEKSTYWNISGWIPLFSDGRKSSDFYFTYSPRGAVINLERGRNKQHLYRGLVISLTIQCTDTKDKPHPESCLMFKTEGRRDYELPETMNRSLHSTAYQNVTSFVNITETFGDCKCPIVKSSQEEKFEIIVFTAIFCGLLLLLNIVIITCLWKRYKKYLIEIDHKKQMLQAMSCLSFLIKSP